MECGKNIKGQQGNTTNLKNHLKASHRTQFQEYERLDAMKKEDEHREKEEPKIKQPTLQVTFDRSTPYGCYEERR